MGAHDGPHRGGGAELAPRHGRGSPARLAPRRYPVGCGRGFEAGFRGGRDLVESRVLQLLLLCGCDTAAAAVSRPVVVHGGGGVRLGGGPGEAPREAEDGEGGEDSLPTRGGDDGGRDEQPDDAAQVEAAPDEGDGARALARGHKLDEERRGGRRGDALA